MFRRCCCGSHVDSAGGDGELASLVETSYLHGHVRSDEAYDAMLSSLFSPPWFSWADGAGGPSHDSTGGRAQLKEACERVLDHVATHGPFDGAFGFSQGALVLTIVSSAKARHSLGIVRGVRSPPVPPSSMGRYSEEAEEAEEAESPFRFAILACGAGPLPGLGIGAEAAREGEPAGGLITIPSLHLIGAKDPIAPRSRQLLALWGGEKLVVHEGGHTHALPMDLRRDRSIRGTVRTFLLARIAEVMAEVVVRGGEREMREEADHDRRLAPVGVPPPPASGASDASASDCSAAASAQQPTRGTGDTGPRRCSLI